MSTIHFAINFNNVYTSTVSAFLVAFLLGRMDVEKWRRWFIHAPTLPQKRTCLLVRHALFSFGYFS
jgi:hypothetical protein